MCLQVQTAGKPPGCTAPNAEVEIEPEGASRQMVDPR